MKPVLSAHRDPAALSRPSLGTVAREWGRIGCIGFGGPPAHIKLLPGPASTELAIFCAWRLRGRAGALVGGPAFIVPGLIVILALAALFLSGSPPLWVVGAGAGGGAAVPAVAAQAGTSLLSASWQRRRDAIRWVCYLAAGIAAAAAIGAWLVLVLLACGVIELSAQRAVRREPKAHGILVFPLLAAGTITGGVLASVAWVAFKVGALSYGGGFVIIPLMRSDAVSHYHWMTGAPFLNAVALGQIIPGPVVQTVAVVGYAAAGLAGGLLAATVAFTPFLRVRLPRRPPVRPDPQRPESPRFPRRRRPSRDRRHPRLGDLPGQRAHPALAIRCPRHRAHPAPGAAPQRRPHHPGSRRSRNDNRARRCPTDGARAAGNASQVRVAGTSRHSQPSPTEGELVVDPACGVGQGLLTWPGPEIAVATAAGSPRSTAAEHIPGQESPRLPDWDRGLYSGAVDEVMRTVAEAMLTTPVRHPLSATVGEIRDFFRDDHVHAALIVSPAGYLDGRNRTAESHCHQR